MMASNRSTLRTAYPRVEARPLGRHTPREIQPAARGLAIGLADFDRLFLLVLAVDLFTPFLIWKGVLPAAVRWGSHAGLLAMIVHAYGQMMHHNLIPRIVWLLLFMSAIGVVVAYLSGQGLTATGWGWWVMFQYPLVGLYAYSKREWPVAFARRFRRLCVAILGLQVLVQIGQYLTGEIPGDNLAGTFGRHGTANLVVLIMLVVCLGLGEWLADRRWKTLALALVLGMIASVLGEMKLYLPVMLVAAALAMVIFAVQVRQVGKLLQYVVLLALVVWGFALAYDAVVSRPRGTRPLAAYLEWETVEWYLGGVDRSVIDDRFYYDVGRNYAVQYGWSHIRRDATTLLFGMGLGARGESRTLGTAGEALVSGQLGLNTGTSLLVIMQETGVVGLSVLGGFILWLVVTLWRQMQLRPKSPANALRYGLILFSVLWPLWLWYSTAWTFRVPMLLYWTALAYALVEPRLRHRTRATHTVREDLPARRPEPAPWPHGGKR